jgi:hypothetical protein
MGRGRAKAKQTKVARRLKYTTTATDLEALRSELLSNPDADHDELPVEDMDEVDEEDDEDDEDSDWSTG